MAGNIKKHIAYIVPSRRAAEAVASIDDPNNVPVVWRAETEELAKATARDRSLTGDFGGLSLKIALPRLAPAIIAHMDGSTSIGAIAQALAKAGGHDASRTLKDTQDTVRSLIDCNLASLRRPAPTA
jgi:hypothetical protein